MVTVDCAVIPAVLEAGITFAETKIENLSVTLLGNENVRGLDVAMHDASDMSGIERICDLDS